jgi:hypothetical protein
LPFDFRSLRFRTQLCRDGQKCTRPICFFAHTPGELRQPKEDELPPTNSSLQLQHKGNHVSSEANSIVAPFQQLYYNGSASFQHPPAAGMLLCTPDALQRHNGVSPLPAAAVAAVPSTFNFLQQHQQQQVWPGGQVLACGPAYGSMVGVPVLQYNHSQPVLLQYSSSMPMMDGSDVGLVQLQRRRSAPSSLPGEACSNEQHHKESPDQDQEVQQQEQQQQQPLPAAAADARQALVMSWTIPRPSSCMLQSETPTSGGALLPGGASAPCFDLVPYGNQQQQQSGAAPMQQQVVTQGFGALESREVRPNGAMKASQGPLPAGMVVSRHHGVVVTGYGMVQTVGAPVANMLGLQDGPADSEATHHQLPLAYYRPAQE